MVKNCFCFHNVGQGLFYSGMLTAAGSKEIFTFVYDCGTATSGVLENRVLRFVKTLPCSKIDLLVLSHLHEDHINGLRWLMEEYNVAVDTVVMPYLSPTELIWCGSEASTRPSTFVYSVLRDPIGKLRELGVNNIVCITYDGMDPEERQQSLQEADNRNALGADSPAWDLLPPLGDLRNISKRGAPHVIYARRACYAHKDADNTPYWQFVFSNPEPKGRTNAEKQFLAELESDPMFQSITNLSGYDLSEEVLCRIQKDVKTKKRLKELYKKCCGDLNRSSLLMYHAPVDVTNAALSFHSAPAWPRYIGLCAYKTLNTATREPCTALCNKFYGVGTLLTGDISELNPNKLGRISETAILRGIQVFSVPHHGSKHIRIAASHRFHPEYGVVSCGADNAYGHPSVNTLREIAQRGIVPVIADENHALEYCVYYDNG